MKSIAVYCGSAPGADPAYLEAAISCGKTLAEAGITLVYGGGRVGLMGAVADAALAAGGKVIGVMPEDLVRQEIAHRGLTDLHVVASMHERKKMMADLAEGFISLPGGPGTYEEFLEQWTWALLGVHAKPSGFVNVHGYYDLFRQSAQQMATAGFLAQAYVDMLIFEETAAGVVDRFASYVAPPPKWSVAPANR